MNQNGGIYVHLPFCASICPYCDFSVLKGDASKRSKFVDTLVREISLCRQSPSPDFVGSSPSPQFDTLFLGGGTPSLLEDHQLETVLDHINRTFELIPNPWIAIEVNPEDVTRARLRAWKELGVSYVSLGIQSFNRNNLEFLGRNHTEIQARRAISEAKQLAFPTVSIDLIQGLPGQTEINWLADLEVAAGCKPDHISCYQLTIEPSTPFGVKKKSGQLLELPHDQQTTLFFSTHRFLQSKGYSSYEVSNFASSSEHRSRHNQKYWHHSPYIGLGPSAHSYSNRSRWWNQRQLRDYARMVDAGERPIAEHENLDNRQVCLEMIALGIRTSDGVDLRKLPGNMRESLYETNKKLLESWVDDDLIEVGEHSIRPTLAGMAVADSLARSLSIPHN